MYFVHPQIKLNKKNLKSIFFSFFKPIDSNYLKAKLSFYFPEKQIIFTDMGRTAFKVIIKKLNLQNSEILFPAYICDIFYPILKKYNIKPIFLDIDLKTFHIKIEEIENKITDKTRAILVCHTYGLPFDIKTIQTSKNLKISNLLIIEDCAHSFGAQLNRKFTGNFGDAAFFSLYKFLPSLRGGLLVAPRDWQANLSKTSFNFRDFLSLLNCFSCFAFFFKKFGEKLAPRMLRKEKLSILGGINKISLNLFINFLEDFEKDLKKKIHSALFFQEELKKLGFKIQESKNNVFCFLSALVPKELEQKRDEIVKKLRKYKIFCTRIWHTPIILNSEVQKEYQINLDEFPNTIEAAKRIINFPLQNHCQKKDIEIIVKAIKETLSSV